MALDDEFIASLKRGEDDAYELLVCRFETPLYRYFFGLHGDPQLAGEQTADCFSELVKSLPKMAGGANQLRPFVFAVAKNIARRQWRLRTHDSYPLNSADDAVDHCPGPESVAEAAEESARLIAAIRLLDAATRDVFLLRFVDELPIAEIAEALGEPIGTVKSRLHRGRQRLQEILQSRSGLP